MVLLIFNPINISRVKGLSKTKKKELPKVILPLKVPSKERNL